VGKTDAPDDSGYLKWRMDPTSPREQLVWRVVYVVGIGVQSIPRYVTTNHAIIRDCEIAGLAILGVACLVGLSKIHSY